MVNLQGELEKFKLTCPVTYNTPLASYTTFEVGGPADVLAKPRTPEEAAEIVAVHDALGAPLTVLGGGANVVVSDAGIRGIVLHTGLLNSITLHPGPREDRSATLTVDAGAAISDAAAYAADHDLGGLSFIYAMPGTTGGAIWMNARCYDGEIAAVLASVACLELTGDRKGQLSEYYARPEDFAYKISPFQDGSRLILSGTFVLESADGTELWARMRAHRDDRRAKGHFDAPCAGSIFKNNRAFGSPSGQIIDRLGLRGHQIGGARVSDRHGNIIVNTGSATARDIRALAEYVQDRVARETGYTLEPEVLFVGAW